ncbi:MAG: hypothetical protein CL862_07705 [Cyanobium sp. NAT70]|nr:hypothetical protein [Cyanobium sp. NAT70]|tara:strand:+ start:84 stop:518 length:435 start_codon:yes stop_codon:yes gene_type:complete
MSQVIQTLAALASASPLLIGCATSKLNSLKLDVDSRQAAEDQCLTEVQEAIDIVNAQAEIVKKDPSILDIDHKGYNTIRYPYLYTDEYTEIEITGLSCKPTQFRDFDNVGYVDGKIEWIAKDLETGEPSVEEVMVTSIIFPWDR